MKRKRIAWDGDAAADAVVQRFGGPEGLRGKFNRLSMLALLDVAKVARIAAERSSDLSASTVASALLGILIEAETVPHQRMTEASSAQIGSHFGLSARATERALEVLEIAGVIAVKRVRGRRLTIQLLDGIDCPQTESRISLRRLDSTLRVLPHQTALGAIQAEKCRRIRRHSPKSAVASVGTPEKVPSHTSSPNTALTPTQSTIDTSVAPELRADPPSSLESERSHIETRARAPENDGAAPTLDAFEIDPGWFSESPDQEPELRRGEIPTASEMSSAILTTADRDQLRSLGIEPHLIDGAVACGITSDELRPVMLEAECASSERFLRRARVAMWIRSTARERGHPIADPEPAQSPKPKRKALA